jgi:hypothetical protein
VRGVFSEIGERHRRDAIRFVVREQLLARLKRSSPPS